MHGALQTIPALYTGASATRRARRSTPYLKCQPTAAASLGLPGAQDEALNELLPFGEYVLPERVATSSCHRICAPQLPRRSQPYLARAQDEALNELLPFGEYVPPERVAASAPQFVMGLDAWELEQLLQRLAVVNGPGAASSRRDRRRHHHHRSHHTAHASSSSGQPSHDTHSDASATLGQMTWL